MLSPWFEKHGIRVHNGDVDAAFVELRTKHPEVFDDWGKN